MRFIGQSICGATLVLAAGSAAAQSSVTLYGVVDVFGQYLMSGSGTKAGPGTAYAAGKHTYSEGSGGTTGSQFGMKGNEDLGGGLQAQFDVETGFNVNNGAFFASPSTLFYRQAWVGLNDSKYGSLSFGRQYEPSFRVIYPTEPFRANEIMSPLSAMVLATDSKTLSTQYDPGRSSNSILYQSPNVGGLQFSGMYALASTMVLQTATASTTINSGNMLNVAASYTGYGLYAALAYVNQHPGTLITAALPAALSPLNMLSTEHFIGALAYRIGIVNFQFNYSYTRASDAPAGSPAALLGSAHSNSVAEVGATIQATSADTVELAAIERNVRGVHDNTPGFQVGVDHQLSKRTSVYMRAGYLKNNGVANVSWPGNTANDGSKQVLAVVGMTHRF